MNSRLVEMIARGRLPLRGGEWIDTYNQTTDPQCAGTIIAGINAKNHYYVMEENYRIRKLTPRECFRLMGVSEPDIDKLLSAGISNSQLYKMAGNSIVVNTISAIFRQLFIGNFNKQTQTEIF